MVQWTMMDDQAQYDAAEPCDERGNVLTTIKPPAEDAEAQAIRNLSAKIGPNLARVAAGIRFVRDSILRPVQSTRKGG